MDWSSAHRLAMLAAARVHDELGHDVTKRVEIFDIVESSGILLAFQPFAKLSGAYFADTTPPGIVINSFHPIARQRYTCGHEFGHHVLGHGTRVDEQREDHLRKSPRVLSDDEMVAEAFASWLLMPKSLVNESIHQMGLERVESPRQIYSLALRLGTSYDATLRQLSNLGLIQSSQFREWSQVQLRSIKLASAPAKPPKDLHLDVWLFDETDRDRTFVVKPGDRLVVKLRETPSSGVSWELTEIPIGTLAVSDSFLEAFEEEPDQLFVSETDNETIGNEIERRFIVDLDPESDERFSKVLAQKKFAGTADSVDDWQVQLLLEHPRRGIAPDKLALAS